MPVKELVEVSCTEIRNNHSVFSAIHHIEQFVIENKTDDTVLVTLSADEKTDAELTIKFQLRNENYGSAQSEYNETFNIVGYVNTLVLRKRQKQTVTALIEITLPEDYDDSVDPYSSVPHYCFFDSSSVLFVSAVFKDIEQSIHIPVFYRSCKSNFRINKKKICLPKRENSCSILSITNNSEINLKVLLKTQDKYLEFFDCYTNQETNEFSIEGFGVLQVKISRKKREPGIYHSNVSVFNLMDREQVETVNVLYVSTIKGDLISCLHKKLDFGNCVLNNEYERKFSVKNKCNYPVRLHCYSFSSDLSFGISSVGSSVGSFNLNLRQVVAPGEVLEISALYNPKEKQKGILQESVIDLQKRRFEIFVKAKPFLENQDDILMVGEESKCKMMLTCRSRVCSSFVNCATPVVQLGQTLSLGVPVNGFIPLLNICNVSTRVRVEIDKSASEELSLDFPNMENSDFSPPLNNTHTKSRFELSLQRPVMNSAFPFVYYEFDIPGKSFLKIPFKFVPKNPDYVYRKELVITNLFNAENKLDVWIHGKTKPPEKVEKVFTVTFKMIDFWSDMPIFSTSEHTLPSQPFEINIGSFVAHYPFFFSFDIHNNTSEDLSTYLFSPSNEFVFVSYEYGNKDQVLHEVLKKMVKFKRKLFKKDQERDENENQLKSIFCQTLFHTLETFLKTIQSLRLSRVSRNYVETIIKANQSQKFFGIFSISFHQLLTNKFVGFSQRFSILYSDVNYNTDFVETHVNVTGEVVLAVLEVQQSNINLGTLKNKEERTITILISNPSEVSIPYRIVLPENSALIAGDPLYGFIQKNSSSNFRLIIKPTVPGKLLEKISIKNGYDPDNSQTVTVKGTVSRPRGFIVSTNQIYLGTIFVQSNLRSPHELLRKSFSITNTSSLKHEFLVEAPLFAANFEFFTPTVYLSASEDFSSSHVGKIHFSIAPKSTKVIYFAVSFTSLAAQHKSRIHSLIDKATISERIETNIENSPEKEILNREKVVATFNLDTPSSFAFEVLKKTVSPFFLTNGNSSDVEKKESLSDNDSHENEKAKTLCDQQITEYKSESLTDRKAMSVHHHELSNCSPNMENGTLQLYIRETGERSGAKVVRVEIDIISESELTYRRSFDVSNIGKRLSFSPPPYERQPLPSPRKGDSINDVIISPLFIEFGEVTLSHQLKASFSIKNELPKNTPFLIFTRPQVPSLTFSESGGFLNANSTKNIFISLSGAEAQNTGNFKIVILCVQKEHAIAVSYTYSAPEVLEFSCEDVIELGTLGYELTNNLIIPHEGRPVKLISSNNKLRESILSRVSRNAHKHTNSLSLPKKRSSSAKKRKNRNTAFAKEAPVSSASFDNLILREDEWKSTVVKTEVINVMNSSLGLLIVSASTNNSSKIGVFLDETLTHPVTDLSLESGFSHKLYIAIKPDVSHHLLSETDFFSTNLENKIDRNFRQLFSKPFSNGFEYEITFSAENLQRQLVYRKTITVKGITGERKIAISPFSRVITAKQETRKKKNNDIECHVDFLSRNRRTTSRDNDVNTNETSRMVDLESMSTKKEQSTLSKGLIGKARFRILNLSPIVSTSIRLYSKDPNICVHPSNITLVGYQQRTNANSRTPSPTLIPLHSLSEEKKELSVSTEASSCVVVVDLLPQKFGLNEGIVLVETEKARHEVRVRLFVDEEAFEFYKMVKEKTIFSEFRKEKKRKKSHPSLPTVNFGFVFVVLNKNGDFVNCQNQPEPTSCYLKNISTSNATVFASATIKGIKLNWINNSEKINHVINPRETDSFHFSPPVYFNREITNLELVRGELVPFKGYVDFHRILDNIDSREHSRVTKVVKCVGLFAYSFVSVSPQIAQASNHIYASIVHPKSQLLSTFTFENNSNAPTELVDFRWSFVGENVPSRLECSTSKTIVITPLSKTNVTVSIILNKDICTNYQPFEILLEWTNKYNPNPITAKVQAILVK